jgi:hypothetical protein
MSTASGEAPGEQANSAEDVLRSAFVEMLFALAASQVAIYAADVVAVSAAPEKKAPAIAHLAAGLVLIATSWIGWRQSQSPGMKEKVTYWFSWTAIGLLMDVILVIVYFILVRRVELTVDQNGKTQLGTASAEPEALWLCVVFGIYAFWDLVADVFSQGCLPQGSVRERVLIGLKASIVSTSASVLSLIMTFVALRVASGASDWSVVLIDGMLICTLLFFRSAKALENSLADFLKVRGCKAFKERRTTQGLELWQGIVLIGAFATLWIGTRWL